MQYTIRKIPQYLDEALRQKAKNDGKSMNQIALEALIRGLSLETVAVPQRNLNDIAGQWAEDPEFDQALAEMNAVDPHLWP